MYPCLVVMSATMQRSLAAKFAELVCRDLFSLGDSTFSSSKRICVYTSLQIWSDYKSNEILLRKKILLQ